MDLGGGRVALRADRCGTKAERGAREGPDDL